MTMPQTVTLRVYHYHVFYIYSFLSHCFFLVANVYVNRVEEYSDHTCFFMHLITFAVAQGSFEPEAARPRLQTASKRHG